MCVRVIEKEGGREGEMSKGRGRKGQRRERLGLVF